MSESYKAEREKVILHMDGDAFFVAVEIAKDPRLKGLPVVTGGERGIASAFSYEAKALGITRAMPIQKIKRNFPQVVVCNSDYAAYKSYSKRMFAIVRRYADVVEEYSIDECFAELTGLDKPLKMSYEDMAKRIKKEVKDELGLSVTIGLAPTKVLAKVASNWQKPNGFTVITKDTIEEFLSMLPVAKIWGIGPRTSELLMRLGVSTAQAFVTHDMRWVYAHLPAQYGNLWKELQGISVLPLHYEAKTSYTSIQRMHTFFPATCDKQFLLAQLSKHVEDVCTQARRYSQVAKKCTITLRDAHLRYTSLPLSLKQATNAPEILMELVEKHFDELFIPTVLYRATGITLQNLSSNVSTQATLFDTEPTRTDVFQALHEEIDMLERKFGKRVVHLASTHQALSGVPEIVVKDEEERNLLFS